MCSLLVWGISVWFEEIFISQMKLYPLGLGNAMCSQLACVKQSALLCTIKVRTHGTKE